jgi:hypothetical protein
MKKIALGIFCIFISYSSFAEIYQVEDFTEIKGLVGDIFDKRNPQKILFILPLDLILRPTHPAIQQQDENYHSLMNKAFEKANKSSLVYANTLLLTDYPNDLTDPAVLDLVDYIQKNNSELIITTPNFTGEFNAIERLDVWTFNYLKSKKIDLTKGVFSNMQLVFNQEIKKTAGGYPTFYKGLLSYNSDKSSNSSMQILSIFLVSKLQKIQDVVVVLDSRKVYLDALEKQLKILRQDNEFFVILYNLPVLKTKEILPEDYLKFWQNFVKKLNLLKNKNVNSKTKNPYEE